MRSESRVHRSACKKRNHPLLLSPKVGAPRFYLETSLSFETGNIILESFGCTVRGSTVRMHSNRTCSCSSSFESKNLMSSRECWNLSNTVLFNGELIAVVAGLLFIESHAPGTRRLLGGASSAAFLMLLGCVTRLSEKKTSCSSINDDRTSSQCVSQANGNNRSTILLRMPLESRAAMQSRDSSIIFLRTPRLWQTEVLSYGGE